MSELSLEDKKEIAKFHNEMVKKCDALIKRRMNILKYDDRLRQKMENEIKKKLS
jgi:hypothetical protein